MKKTLVIVEGPDNIGKTTLAKHLERSCEFKYLKPNFVRAQFDSPEDEFNYTKEVNTQTYNTLITLLEHYDKVVLDRWWLSGVTYNIARYGYTDFTKELLKNFIKHITELLGNFDIEIKLIVGVLARTKHQLHRITSEDAPYLNNEDIYNALKTINTAYKGVCLYLQENIQHKNFTLHVVSLGPTDYLMNVVNLQELCGFIKNT